MSSSLPRGLSVRVRHAACVQRRAARGAAARGCARPRPAVPGCARPRASCFGCSDSSGGRHGVLLRS